MPSHHLSTNRRTALRALLCAAGGTLTVVGCESFRNTTTTTTGTPTDPARASVPVKKPGKHYLKVGQYVFYSDVPLEANDQLFHELEGLQDQVQQELKLPPGPQMVQVFLFETQDRYEAFMKDRYPWLPIRRAYFIGDQKRAGAADDLQVFTWMGEHIRTDLRHELTHATLNGVLKGVPIWLDEGLAGYFEQPEGMDGVNPAHLKAIKDGPFLPELARLEKFRDVKDMGQPEYREAWAWVHFLMHDPKAKPVLLEYIAKLRDDPNPGLLLPKLQAAVGNPTQALAEHLTRTSVPSARARAAK